MDKEAHEQQHKLKTSNQLIVPDSGQYNYWWQNKVYRYRTRVEEIMDQKEHQKKTCGQNLQILLHKTGQQTKKVVCHRLR